MRNLIYRIVDRRWLCVDRLAAWSLVRMDYKADKLYYNEYNEWSFTPSDYCCFSHLRGFSYRSIFIHNENIIDHARRVSNFTSPLKAFSVNRHDSNFTNRVLWCFISTCLNNFSFSFCRNANQSSSHYG